MKITKGLAITAIVVGFVLVGLSYYIQSEVNQGRLQVESAERSLKRGQSLFSLTPATNQIGQEVQRSADRKIGEANSEINYYAAMAELMLLIGYALIILGVAVFVIIRFRRK